MNYFLILYLIYLFFLYPSTCKGLHEPYLFLSHRKCLHCCLPDSERAQCSAPAIKAKGRLQINRAIVALRLGAYWRDSICKGSIGIRTCKCTERCVRGYMCEKFLAEPSHQRSPGLSIALTLFHASSRYFWKCWRYCKKNIPGITKMCRHHKNLKTTHWTNGTGAEQCIHVKISCRASIIGRDDIKREILLYLHRDFGLCRSSVSRTLPC